MAVSSSAVAVRPRRTPWLLTPAESDERWLRRRIGLTWTLLVINVLTFEPGVSILHIPSSVGKAITQGVLPVALVMALTLNRRVIVRPNIFLCLVSLLVIEAILTCLDAQYLRGTAYRTFRLAEFVAALWLLSPYWGRRDLLLVRCHLRVMLGVLISVLVGLAVAPGYALHAGRLGGAIWPIPATQVAHYAAVTIGLTVVLWLSGEGRGRTVLLIVALAGTILILTRTRTALVGLVFGLTFAGLSLIVAKPRARKLFGALGAAALVAIVAFSGPITTWLARGEGTSQLTNLSGRTNFWAPLLAFPRTRFQEIFGFGLSNGTFNGLPIDSNWLDSYLAQGLFGVAVCAAILVFLIVTAYFQPRGVKRALALFLIMYCLIASFTEVGFTDASTYMLDLTVAASLLVPSLVSERSAF
jgi:uncharacterized membrane protein